MRRAVFLTEGYPESHPSGANRRLRLTGEVMRDHGWEILYATTRLCGHPDEFLLPGNRFALNKIPVEASILRGMKADLFHMHGLCPRAASLRLARPAILRSNPSAKFLLGVANQIDQRPDRNRLRLAEMAMSPLIRPAAWCVAAMRDRAAMWGRMCFDRVWVYSREQEEIYSALDWMPVDRLDGIVEIPERVAEAPARFTALFLGAVRHVKGIDRMLELAARPALKSIRFVVAGPMLERQYEDRVMEAHHRGDIEYTGPLDRAGVDRALVEASLLINTSRSEGTPVAYLEAWAAGRPVLAWEADYNGLLRDGAMGWVCGGMEGLERLLLRLAASPAEVATAGRNGRAWAEKNAARSRMETQLRAVLAHLELPLDA